MHSNYLVSFLFFEKQKESYPLVAQQRLEYSSSPASARRDRNRVHRAYAYLQAANNISEGLSNQESKLLKNFEIPRFLLRSGDRSDRSYQISSRGETPWMSQRGEFLDARTPDRISGETLLIIYNLMYIENYNNFSIGSIMDEFIEDEEIEHRTLDDKKTSFRIKSKKEERRFSRIQMGKEKSASKLDGLKVKWGINMY